MPEKPTDGGSENAYFCQMSSYHPRPRQPSGAPELCLPTSAKAPPCGPDWIREIKHDGCRVLARRAGSKVLLISRKGHDLTYRFPLVASLQSSIVCRAIWHSLQHAWIPVLSLLRSIIHMQIS